MFRHATRLGATLVLCGVAAAQTTLGSSSVPFATGFGAYFGACTAVLDTQRDVVVALHWRPTAERATWEWDGVTWTLRDVRPTTNDRNLAYDPLRGRSVLLCGDGATWEWDGQTWTQTVAANAGPALTGAGMAFDGQRIVVYGGRGTFNQIPYDLTFTYDGVAWTQASPTLVPPFRPFSQLCYDPSRGVVVMVGDGSTLVHEWDGTDWTIVGPTPWTNPRSKFALAFHAARGRVWLAGGSEPVALPGGPVVVVGVLDTYEWDGAAWTQVADLPTAATSPAGFTTPAGDAAVFAGFPQAGANADVQSLLSTTPATFDVVGAGCAGSNGAPTLSAAPWDAAWIGDDARVQLDGAPASTTTVVFAWALSATADAFGPLPRDLSVLGLTGCSQRTSSDLLALAPAAGGTAATTLPIPANPALAGFEVFTQAIVPDAAANAFGATLSDAMRFVVGVR